jgi:nucleoside-diphosphate-sugar epimerase
MTIFATGTSGTIGRHLRLDTVPMKFHPDFSILDCRFKTIQSTDAILHLAGVVGDQKVEQDLELSRRVNVDAVARLGKEVRDSCDGRLVYVSTSHVYAKSNDPIGETFKTSPKSNYARQKLEAEDALINLFHTERERLCIVRIFSILDWDVAEFTLGGAIRKIVAGNSDFTLKNCDDVRDFLTPKTAARSLIAISRSHNLSGILNLCSGVGVRVGDAAERMLQESSFIYEKSRLKNGNSDNPRIIGDNRNLKSYLPSLQLEWKPSVAHDL